MSPIEEVEKKNTFDQDFINRRLWLREYLYYIYLIIAYVGTWKSATNFKRKKNQWSWGTIAKVDIVLNILNGINQLIFN